MGATVSLFATILARRSDRSDPDGAIFGNGNDPSSCYRYVLWRTMDATNPRTMVVIGVNPSTATATEDDPTIRRCKRFALDSGHGKLVMLNCFAFRATDVKALVRADGPIGPENHERVMAESMAADTVVCAWGSREKLPRDFRAWPAGICGSLASRGVVVHAFRLLRNGDPEHPLYLPASCRPIPWSP